MNSTSGPLNAQNNEASDLQNIDFDKFGSILKRSGYASVTTGGAITTASEGLHWYEYNAAGVATRYGVGVTSAGLFYLPDLAGSRSDITNGLTITPNHHCDFENFLNNVYITNGYDLPFMWAGGSTAGVMPVPSGLTKAKYVKQFNNYLFLGNVTVSSVSYPSRLYWSNIKNTNTWDSTQFIEVSKDDGQEITGIKVLQDRLVVYKQRAIYNLFFTGDADIPFILPGGGKSNSAVGCIAPFSIQEVENGHVFLAHDGIYYYDGQNSYKLSYKIQYTLVNTLNTLLYGDAVSCVYKAKNRYMLAVCSAGHTTHDTIIIWDYFNNAFSVYTGINASSMSTFFESGFQELPYFADYNGYIYKMDTGSDDYPLGVQTAINAYYSTNWRTFDDLCDQKGVPHIYLYYQAGNSILTFSYSYDFDTTTQYSQTINLSPNSSRYGTARYDISKYSGSGGSVQRRDLTGRGRAVRLTFANANLGETMQIDGIGSYVHAETNA